ncbi:membrane protein [Salisediminibacterium halotolerans]|nr:membrane protein [Salisediminibacterium halotolerans]
MLPGIGNYVKLFYTMLHETCHALAARLSGGKVKRVHLYATTAGMAETTHRSRAGAAWTAFAGYPLASLIVTAGIYAYMQGFTEQLLWLFAALVAYQCIFWVRNAAGLLWLLSVLGGLFALYYWQLDTYFDLAVQLVLVVLWSQAFFSSWTVFRLAFIDKNQAGDATILARQTKIPAVFWGFLFAVSGTVFFIIGLWLFLGGSEGFDIVSMFDRM